MKPLLIIIYYYLLLPFQPFMSDKLIRASGRLSNSCLPLHLKHQVIIDKTHPLASLLIAYIHERNFHCGREPLLSLLRKKYWMINAQALIRNVLSNCRRCRSLTIRSMMGNLPCERLSIREHPFSCTGVTSLGHYLSKYVKGLEFLQVQEKVLV